ncbi:MAG TPA: HD domain-containing phosphohydrolase [Candidatus Angelobacter sp.]
MAELPIRARLFLLLVWTAGAVSFGTGMLPWHSSNGWLFGSYVALTALASAFKTVLPGLEGTISANDVFFLVGVCTMSLSETLALALVPTAVQCFWRRQKRLGIVHFAFNFSQVGVAITGAYWSYQLFLNHIFFGRAPLALLVAAVVYFLLNTMAVATMVALADGTSIRKKWANGYLWTFPYCMVGAAIAGIIQLVNRIAGWEMSILVLPAVYAIYRSYHMQLGRWEDERVHLQEIASLHARTIETLALAIEAKDHTTGDHLQRVRVYASELAKDLGLSEIESEALQAASVLHDIGKLAVPEHIISKPGKLTPEEFDKMKIHPIVGAEILEQVRFPYPVAAVVRSHHEKWDGSGYPDGLAGGAIPIGARILSAVDCLDALASDRQYRRALPLDEAMAHVEQEAGKAFDPRVVAALKLRYVELEQLARSQEPMERPTLSVDVKVNRGAAPDAGFAVAAPIINGFSSVNPSERRDAFDTFAPYPDKPLSLHETFSTAAVRLRHLIPFDALAVFIGSNDVLTPHFVLGENTRQLSALRVPSGKGLVGWVAETGNCIVNGNPTVEPGSMEQMRTNVVLRSALAVPLQDAGRVVGVLALYHIEPEAFTPTHLGFLQNSRRHLGAAIAQHLGNREQPADDSLQEVAHALGPHLVSTTRAPRPF